MDDILASIRRIISDDDPSPRPQPARPPERAPARSREAAPSQDRSAPQPAPRVPERPLSYAPRRAAAPYAAPHGAGPNGSAHLAGRTSGVADPWIERPISGALGDAFDGFERDVPPAASYAPTHSSEAQSDFDPVPVRESLREAAPSYPDEAYHPQSYDPAPQPQPRRKDLLAPEVDAAVAAAFGTLGDLVVPAHERTLEGLVKEMLRPMLKTWLDDNLPRLVEDLVRQEIERISRQSR